MADDALDAMPLELLLALRDAMAGPTEEGQRRAQQRAADAGFHIECLNEADEMGDLFGNSHPPRIDKRPIAMDPAPPGSEGVRLDFEDSQGSSSVEP